MKKTGKILLTVASIISLVGTIAVALLGLVFIIIALVSVTSPFITAESLRELTEWAQSLDPSINETGIRWIVAGVIAGVTLICFLIYTVVYLVATILLFKAAKQQSKGSQIAGIVVGVLTTPVGWLAIVGCILSLIGMGIEEKRQQEAAQPKEEAKEEPKQVEAK